MFGHKPTRVGSPAPEDGHNVIYTVSIALVRETGVALAAFQDITDITASSQIRRDFVANVSYELRTSLTALMGFFETLCAMMHWLPNIIFMAH